MSLPTTITFDGEDAEVRENALLVAEKVVAPTEDEAARVVAYTGLFRDAAGSSDMSVDGTTPVAFLCKAETASDGYLRNIHSVRLVFHSTNMVIATNESRRFGPIAAPGLTNGLTFKVHQNGGEADVFLNPVKVIGDFYRYAGGSKVSHDGITNDTDAIAATVDFFMVFVAFDAPLRLYPGTDDRLEIVVQDDLTGIQLFETQVYGTRERV